MIVLVRSIRASLLSASLLVLFPLSAAAQLSITTPGSDTSAAACDEYFTDRLADPVDMSNTADINNYLREIDVTGLTNLSWSGGVFGYQTTAANQGIYFLFSPDICNFVSGRGGTRWGSQLPLTESSVASKYRHLTVRMYTDPSTRETNGWAALFNRSCDATQDYTITNFMPVSPGWSNYTVDLSDASKINTGASLNTTNWTAGSITGLAIKPATEGGIIGRVDYVRLEDSSSCSSTSVSYTAAATAAASRFNIYLDDDTSIANGYHSKIVSAAAASNGSVGASTLGLQPGSYHVNGLLHSDVFTLSDNPLDFSDANDVDISAGLTNLRYEDGKLKATTSAENQQIYFNLPEGGVDASTYRYLFFKLNRTSSSDITIFAEPAYGKVLGGNGAEHLGGGLYRVDLTVSPAFGTWSGTKTQLIMRPSFVSGDDIELDFVYLTADDDSAYHDSAAQNVDALRVSAPGRIVVNNGPLLSILEPDDRGEAFRPWNLRDSNELVIYGALRDDLDPSYPGEGRTAYLPDVRTVEGVRGDFFKGTTVLGNGDPNTYFTFLTVPNNPVIDGATYKHACMRMAIDYQQDFCLGSLVRYTAANAAGEFAQTFGVSWIHDHWTSSKMSPEICVDLTAIPLQMPGLTSWPADLHGFRVDQHEFEKDTCTNGIPTGNQISVPFYMDYVKLARTDLVRGNSFPISFRLTDADGENPTVSFFYTQSSTPSGGTLIGSTDSEEGYIVWNTTGVPNGTYYVYGIATDGKNTATAISSGPVVIAGAASAQGTPPLLEVQSPLDGDVVCDDIQIKGYALEPDRSENVVVQVEVDGRYFTNFKPSVYSPAAVSAYPALDSSNAGFNGTFDASGIAAGARSVTITAISSDGDTTSETISVTKAGSGCTSPRSDPDPAGSPINVDTGDTSTDVTTPVISAATLKAPKKGGKKAKKTLSLRVTNATMDSVGCTLTAYTGKSQNNVTTVFKELQATASSVTIRGKLKSAKFARVEKSCSPFGTAASAVKRVSAKKNKKKRRRLR